MGLTVDDLSPDQLDVYTAVWDWIVSKQGKNLRMGGLAGTGKSTVLSLLVAAAPVKTMAVVSFTGKAAGVVMRKLKAAGVHVTSETRVVEKGPDRETSRVSANLPFIGGPVFCNTIHSLVYIPIVQEDGSVTGYKKRTKLDRKYDVIFVDEASMVSPDLRETLEAFEVPVVYVGDHGQLPPVAAEGTFMEEPDLRLEKIHRQAEKNPIIQLAHEVRRMGDRVDYWDWESAEIEVHDRSDRVDVLTAKYGAWKKHKNAGQALGDMCTIVGTNAARIKTNAMIRQALGHRGLKTGHQVVCLRNDKETGVFNGMRGILRSDAVKDPDYPWRGIADVYFPDEELGPLTLPMLGKQFNRERVYSGVDELHWDGLGQIKHMEHAGLLFDWGYALTCHKSQGSQWPDVTVIVSGLGHMDDDTKKKWLYTAVTRARERLTLLV